LALRGYKVTVFEELPKAGGMLYWGIPSYRLPRNILDHEIDDIRNLGVDIRLNTRIGREISFNQLEKDFDFIYLATGAHKSQKMGVPGEDMGNVFGGVEFLREFNANEDKWLKGEKTLGKKVAVIGGGNSAIDAARVALRLGSEVTILYRRLRQDMPAAQEEIKAAEEEGIKIEYLVAPLKIEGKNGKVSSITCQRMTLGDFDNSGRKKPVAAAGSEFTLNVDAIIAAIGQLPDMSFMDNKSGVEINKRDCYNVGKGYKSRTANPRYFAGGDAVTGPDTVIAAIGAGHQTADDIDTAIRKQNGEPAYEKPAMEKINVPLIIDEESIEAPQMHMPEMNHDTRKLSFAEVELGFGREDAIKEACRCLRCDAAV
jgi:NADH-quinone oxidoreductase subunit F